MAFPVDPAPPSVFLRQHDRQHSVGFAEIRGIVGTLGIFLIVEVKFPKQLMLVELERTEVMLFMRVVGLGEIIKLGDQLRQFLWRNFKPFQQVIHASRYYSDPRHVWITLPESIILLGNLLNRL
jgi:hypothetical protein